MKGSETFKKTIKAHLENLAATDSLFAETFKKKGKNLDDCVTYILNEVKKSGCNGFADDEIYGMAVHYYDEDNIKVGGKVSANVVVNHVVELTEEEKAKAREKAVQIATKEMVEKAKKDLKINVQLSEEEISEAKKQAIGKVLSEAQDKVKKKKIEKKPAVKESNQPALF